MWIRRMGPGELDPQWPILRNDTVVASEEDKKL